MFNTENANILIALKKDFVKDRKKAVAKTAATLVTIAKEKADRKTKNKKPMPLKKFIRRNKALPKNHEYGGYGNNLGENCKAKATYTEIGEDITTPVTVKRTKLY